MQELHQEPLEQLAALGLELPQASSPGGNYVSVNIRGNIAYIAIQFPILNGTFLHQGTLGTVISTEVGYEAMQLCALNVLAQIHEKIGFNQLVGINHIDAYYRAAEGWDEAPKVVNGASDLFLKVLGERGKHARAIFGVADLPRNFCVGLTVSCTIHTPSAGYI